MAAIATNPLNANRSRASLRTLAAAILGLGCVVSLALNWPGQLSYDSVIQLHDGRAGHYNPWHPPVMSWLLGLDDSLVPGTGLFIVTDALLIFASLGSLLLLSRRASWPAMLVAAICAMLPQFVLYQGIVWKDVLFADAAVAGFVLLAHGANSWAKRGRQWVLVALSFLFLALATLVRQNGVIVLVVGGISLLAIARANDSGWSKAIACGAGATLIAGCVVAAATFALLARATGVSGTSGQIKLLQLYDIVGVVTTDREMKLDRLSLANPSLERLIRSDGVRLYTPMHNDTLAGSSALQREFNATNQAAIAVQWADIVLHHPLDYLRVRARVFAWTFTAPDPVQCKVSYIGVEGPLPYLRSLGIARSFRPQDRVLSAYAANFVSTPVLSHATFAVLALLLLAFFVRRRRPADLAFAGLLFGALAFAASFFVISIACDYRYLLFLDLAALAALFYSAVNYEGESWLKEWRERGLFRPNS